VLRNSGTSPLKVRLIANTPILISVVGDGVIDDDDDDDDDEFVVGDDVAVDANDEDENDDGGGCGGGIAGAFPARLAQKNSNSTRDKKENNKKKCKALPFSFADRQSRRRRQQRDTDAAVAAAVAAGGGGGAFGGVGGGGGGGYRPFDSVNPNSPLSSSSQPSFSAALASSSLSVTTAMVAPHGIAYALGTLFYFISFFLCKLCRRVVVLCLLSDVVIVVFCCCDDFNGIAYALVRDWFCCFIQRISFFFLPR
jgi:hypothetical protein